MSPPKGPAYFREHAERCYRLAKLVKPETSRQMIELGDEFMAKARALEAEECLEPEFASRLVS